MKKIYLSILATAFVYNVNAQLTLTKAFNEPTAGSINIKKGFDSTAVVPKNTGANQNWNFSTMSSNTLTEVSTFTTAASTPSASLFPLANLAEADGAGGYTYWQTNATFYELRGFADNAGTSITFTNSAIAAIWPVSMGYSTTDLYAGTVNAAAMTGPANGTITTNATGTGTVTLPGNIVFTNCLQLRTTNRMNMILGTFPSSFTIATVSTGYSYFHGTQKFPLVDINYEKQTTSSIAGPTVTTSAKIMINNAVLSGINDLNIDAINYKIYPNPASGSFNVYFSNEKNENLTIEVMNALGQNVKTIDFGNASAIYSLVDVHELNAGVYYVKTTLGNKSSINKLIIQ